MPDTPLFTRFKQNFLPYIELMFQRTVDFTKPICQAIDHSLTQMLTFDTSGIELYVSENNPKTLNYLISRLKTYYKDWPDVDPYKITYGFMPSQAASCPDAKQLYINGHFCYADKFAVHTNGIGIVRYIAFLDDDFKADHPEIPVEKKSDSLDEDKSIGDSAFDTIETYGFLKEKFHFSKAQFLIIPEMKALLKRSATTFMATPPARKTSPWK